MSRRRAEIDTSAPFESVKDAANRFGGIGFWRPSYQKPQEHSSQKGSEILDIVNMEEQAAQLETELIMKERETLDVLKELETTKNTVEELRLKLQEETSEINAALNAETDDKNVNSTAEMGEKSVPRSILLELEQAKLNLSRTTNDLADIRATVDFYNKKIEKERMSLEKTRQRLSSNTSKISSLEKELNQTRRKVQLVNDNEGESSPRDPLDVTRELQKLTSETEKFKNVGEAAKAEVLRAMSEIQQTKSRIKTAEKRLIAAKKMKEAARASEAVALAEIEALSKSGNLCEDVQQKSERVTITVEEYSSLISRAREAEEACNGRIVDAMLQVDEADVSNAEILKKVEEATEEVKISKKALEEALSRVEAADSGKLEVEEALRKWRSEHGQKRHNVQNSCKFKNSHTSSHNRREKESRLLDINGLNLVNDEVKPVLRPTLSIGQILSRKLLLAEDFENGMQEENSMWKRKVSLGQMIGKPSADSHSTEKAGKENSREPLPAKRKKFGFARISLLATKQSQKKKKKTTSSGCRSVQID
ncbi:unnamed protein product [Fraxinus pennsylvanica]|uniref:WEB family protein n=1 Tax=Fraxinus pennsylvanica TaxID=56036 RepID=A0AAD2E960_9LAMI|nr:unnamed protein product [Fraxinus pennsylvanica]